MSTSGTTPAATAVSTSTPAMTSTTPLGSGSVSPRRQQIHPISRFWLPYRRLSRQLFLQAPQGPQLIAWDATYRDSFASSYRSSSTHSPGAVADLAEVSKCQKYQHLPPTHCFKPVAFESLSAVGSRTLAFLKDIGRRIRLETGEPKATFYLLQRLSIAVQIGNCALINGCIG